jgi:RNA polymerase sigma-70 factor (ECF subfamily)
VEEGLLDRAAMSERPRLLGIAYRMTGSYHDAEDIVQEALLRMHRAAPTGIESPPAYLTTITTRLAIDHLRSARIRREVYPGPWLPEPIAADPSPDAASQAVLDDTLSIAFLLMLETLGAQERAVLVLHDVFAYTHGEIAGILERSEASSRQLLRRARQHLQAQQPHRVVDPARHDEVVRRFIAACNGGDFELFLDALSADVELVFDGGPDIKTAARRPITGAARVARFLAYAMSRLGEHRHIHVTTLNGQPAVLIAAHTGTLIGAVFIEPGHDDRAAIIRWVRNPNKLDHLR